MKKVILIILSTAGLSGFSGDEPRGTVRWNDLSDSSRMEVLSQVAQRREGERLVVMRQSIADTYRLDSIRYSVPVKDRRRLRHIGIEGYSVLCDIYPFHARECKGWDGILAYAHAQKCDLSDDDLVPQEWPILCVLDRAYMPKRELKGIVAIWPEDKDFCLDDRDMQPDAFMDKYGLRTVFSNSVHFVRSKCMMIVDYPVPEDDDLVVFSQQYRNDPRYERDREVINAAKERWRGLVGSCHKLVLSQAEASELVALLGEQWYRGDGDRYKDLSKKYPWFLPVDVRRPQTRLGKELRTLLDNLKRRGDPDGKSLHEGLSRFDRSHHHAETASPMRLDGLVVPRRRGE